MRTPSSTALMPKTLLKDIQKELNSKVAEFVDTLSQFQELRLRLKEMLDDAIASGKVQVKTSRDVHQLVDAFAKLADVEAKLAIALTSLMRAMNERDAVAVAMVSAFSSIPLEQPELNRALVPVVAEEDGDEP
jgi:ClpP class serine protease